MKKILTIAAFIFLLSAGTLYGEDYDKEKYILILHSYNLGLEWTRSINDGILKYFEKNSNIYFQIEFMDTKILSNEDYFLKLAEMYKLKFKNIKFDAILSTDDDAFDFLLKYSKELFGETPIVFCGVNYFSDERIKNFSNITGVVESFDILATLENALRICPDTKNIYVISDQTSTGIYNLQLLEKVYPYFDEKYKFTILSDYSMKELLAEVQKISADDSVVLALGLNRDKNGQIFSFRESITMIRKKCKAPIYGVWDFYLGWGIVGGVITSGESQGRLAADMVNRILKGENVKNIKVVKKSQNRLIFDYRELMAHKIPLERAPLESVLINQPYSFFLEHKNYIVSVTSIVLVFTIIIAFLTFNILRRRAVELELIQSEERYKTLIETMNEGFMVRNAYDIFSFVNKKFCNMLGFPREEILGSKTSKFLDENNRDKFGDEMTRRLDGIESSYELQWRNRSGKNIPTIMSPKPMYDFKGKYMGSFAVVTEITELKETERKLADEKERLFVTLSSIADGVITVDKEDNITLMNKVAEELTGWKSGEWIGKKLFEVLILHILSDNKNRIVSNYDFFINKAGDSSLREYALTSKDGYERIIEVKASNITDNYSIVVGIVIVFRDVTEKRRLENELIKNQKIESIGVLAGGIAHDFNNILGGIMGNIYLARLMLSEYLISKDLLELLEDIEKACERAKKLTIQLLTFSSGGRPIKKLGSIKNLLIETVNFALTGSRVDCEYRIDDEVYDVEMDEGQIQQVINNLVINGVQSMPEGGKIEVACSNVDIGADDASFVKEGRYVKISVKDNGVGISSENMKKIFDPYFTTKNLGWGLGLTASYSIIQKHNGYLTVDSKINSGSVFTFYLPASDSKSSDKLSKDTPFQVEINLDFACAYFK
ncbi:MAG TPA: ABC transporter substrate binding protein, partial [Spirochaetota bacterium]|nr:ABC transporter substrate binding protein [Spirochaetota bacterium]